MIGVDTNVLARLFVTDDGRQHAVAGRFFGARDKSDPAFISVLVVVELVWLLDRTFDYPKADILAVLSRVLTSPDFVIERRELVELAVETASASKAGVADVLIAGIAAAHGCATTATFDINASRYAPGMELLK